ncbi:hypothetical protein [Methanohalophilus sp.]|uniref:DUF6951 family protein n=1 Tax=Methanohalophilus sp. TaxID=1966352 RepID=UPI002616EFBB|nr:hypothetical protein [Methanohalophilus sp.]MDK2892558.1 hypothetical protein [Methanohalophilus sp.]
MINIKVNSNICGYKHKIHGEKKGKEISIDIKTGCKKIAQMSHLDVPMMKIFDIKDNYVTEKAHEAKACASCIVPSGVLHACNIEAGFISDTLAKKSKYVSIEFIDEDEESN